MMKARFLALILVLVLAVSAVSVSAQPSGTILEVAAANGNFTTLVAAVEAAGLTDVLNGDGPFTVFAPTDAAFAAVPEVLLNYLLANPDQLARVLTYHVVAGAVRSADVLGMLDADGNASAPTVEGSDLNVSVNLVALTARINNANLAMDMLDIEASNGVIHVIDTVLLPPAQLPEVDPLAVVNNIVTAGSSTVFPVTERMADLFNRDGFAGTITVDSIGSGAGYERFCVNAETDIANASRPIRQSEVEACNGNNRFPVEFYVAIDALAVVVSQANTFADSLTVEQLAAAFSGEAATWADLDARWPAETIRLFAPGSDSGTYDFFVEEVYDSDETFIQNAPGIQFSEDDNVLVQGVIGSPYAIGFFGFAYYQENLNTLRALAIDGVEPNEETGASGEYPLSRPLFIYSDPTIMQEKPQVAAFINYYINNVNAQLGTAADQIGYIPVPEVVTRLNGWLWLAATNTSGM